jgi:hypothetical protein
MLTIIMVTIKILEDSLKKMEIGQLITECHMLTETSMMLTITTVMTKILEVSLKRKMDIKS